MTAMPPNMLRAATEQLVRRRRSAVAASERNTKAKAGRRKASKVAKASRKANRGR